MQFEFRPPARVVFGAGAAVRAAEEARALGLTRVLVIAGASQRRRVDDLLQRLGECAVGVFDEVRAHVPLELADAARERAQQLSADGCVALGGGSAIGLAKAVALQRPWTVIALPTTYAGSAHTSIWGVTDDGRKRTGRDLRVRAATVICDPDLTASLPARIAGPSLMNALAHCVESLYAPGACAPTSLLAVEGVRQIAGALPSRVADGADADVHASALYGACLGGMALESAGTALHHRLCHVLGGAFDTPHAQTHAIVLPYAAAWALDAAPEAAAGLAAALGTPAIPARLRELSRISGAPASLAELGLRPGDLDRAARLLMDAPFESPRALTLEGVRRVLEAAWRGSEPAA